MKTGVYISKNAVLFIFEDEGDGFFTIKISDETEFLFDREDHPVCTDLTDGAEYLGPVYVEKSFWEKLADRFFNWTRFSVEPLP